MTPLAASVRAVTQWTSILALVRRTRRSVARSVARIFRCVARIDFEAHCREVEATGDWSKSRWWRAFVPPWRWPAMDRHFAALERVFPAETVLQALRNPLESKNGDRSWHPLLPHLRRPGAVVGSFAYVDRLAVWVEKFENADGFPKVREKLRDQREYRSWIGYLEVAALLCGNRRDVRVAFEWKPGPGEPPVDVVRLQPHLLAVEVKVAREGEFQAAFFDLAAMLSSRLPDGYHVTVPEQVVLDIVRDKAKKAKTREVCDQIVDRLAAVNVEGHATVDLGIAMVSREASGARVSGPDLSPQAVGRRLIGSLIGGDGEPKRRALEQVPKHLPSLVALDPGFPFTGILEVAKHFLECCAREPEKYRNVVGLLVWSYKDPGPDGGLMTRTHHLFRNPFAQLNVPIEL